MSLLRSIVLIFALLAQALPVQAMMRVNEPKNCAMGCCAWLAEAGISECGCEKTSKPTAPAKAPPASGREWGPQVVWAASDAVKCATRPPKSLSAAKSHFIECMTTKPPQVRLTVLFCSFLN